MEKKTERAFGKVHLETESLRTRFSVQNTVGRKRLNEPDLSNREFYAKLDNPQKIEWLLDSFVRSALNNDFHIWHQNFVDSGSKEDPDWLAIYHGLAETSRKVHEPISELFSWTLQRAQEGVNLVLVHMLWSEMWDSLRFWTQEMVEKWPESANPTALESDWRFERPVVEPAETLPRFPQCSVALTKQARSDCLIKCEKLTYGRILYACSYGLWKCGASDQLLEKFVDERPILPSPFIDSLSTWVSLDGDGGDLERKKFLARELDPLAKALKIECSFGRFAMVIAESDFESKSRALWSFTCCRLKPGSDPTPQQQLTRDLRMGVDLILFKACELRETEAWDTLYKAAMTGHILVIAGETDESLTLVEKLRAMDIKIL